MKPKVTVNPGANQYTGDNERIIEFSDAAIDDTSSGPAGGLIAFRRLERPTGERRLMVQVYRCHPQVDVTIGRPDGDDSSLDAYRTAVAQAEEGLRRLLLFTVPAGPAEQVGLRADLEAACSTVSRVKSLVQTAVDQAFL